METRLSKEEKSNVVSNYDDILQELEPVSKVINDLTKEVDEDLLPQYEKLDFKTVLKEAEALSKKIVDTYCKKYIPEDAQHDDFITYQRFEDTRRLKSMLKDDVMMEHTIQRLVELIDDGDTTPRHFEVLSKLFDTKLKHHEISIRFKTHLLVSWMQLGEDYNTTNLLEEQSPINKLQSKGQDFIIGSHTSIIEAVINEDFDDEE